MPFTATIAPPAAHAATQRVDRRLGLIGDGPAGRRSSRRSRRARSRGQAFGWAWKRRSSGSSYSARQAGHISNAAIVVGGRSYGNAADDREARPAVGAVDERVAVAAVAGSSSSARQSAQVATSGETGAGGSPPASLARIREAALARGLHAPPASTARPRASGGASSAQPSTSSAATPRASPSTSSSTPRVSFSTQPPSSSSRGEAVDEGPEADPLDGAPPTRTRTRRRPDPTAHPARSARAARGRRWPAPPGSAGCSGSG